MFTYSRKQEKSLLHIVHCFLNVYLRRLQHCKKPSCNVVAFTNMLEGFTFDVNEWMATYCVRSFEWFWNLLWHIMFLEFSQALLFGLVHPSFLLFLFQNHLFHMLFFVFNVIPPTYILICWQWHLPSQIKVALHFHVICTNGNMLDGILLKKPSTGRLQEIGSLGMHRSLLGDGSFERCMDMLLGICTYKP